MEAKKRFIKIQDKTYDLRIYSRNVAAVQMMLDNKSFESAAIDANADPVKNTIPFIWGVLQKKEDAISDSDAYDLYDKCVDTGYTSEDFSKLIIDICVASGFFAPARVEILRAIFKRMDETQKTLLEKAEEKQTPEENPN